MRSNYTGPNPFPQSMTQSLKCKRGEYFLLRKLKSTNVKNTFNYDRTWVQDKVYLSWATGDGINFFGIWTMMPIARVSYLFSQVDF